MSHESFRFIGIVLALVLCPVIAAAGETGGKDQVVRIAAADGLPSRVAKSEQRPQLDQIVALLKAGKSADAATRWREFSKAHFATRANRGDLEPLIDWLLYKSYLQSKPELVRAARSVGYQQRRQQSVQGYLSELRQKRQKLSGKTTTVRIVKLRAKTEIGKQPLIFAGERVVTAAQLDGLVGDWETRLAEVGDDAQLANIDLQNMLQKQQQTIQMLSNVSKVLHDTALAVIRKIG